MKSKTYYSFDEIGQELFGLKPYKRVTKDKQKLEAQRTKFLGTCPYCKEPLSYISGTNIVVCQNSDCKGKKNTKKLGDGTEVVVYKPFIKILSDKGTDIANTIFEE